MLYKIEKFQFSPLLAAILNFCKKRKNVKILETVRDRAISTEFFTHTVVGKYLYKIEKFQFSPLLAVILNFCEKQKILISQKPQEIKRFGQNFLPIG